MADNNYANNELQANNGLAYLGVRPTTPPNFYKIPRAPTTTDVQGYQIGDMWLDTSPLTADPPAALTTANIWQLLGKNGPIATPALWVNFIGSTTNGVLTTEGDFGGPIAPDGAGVAFFSGGTTNFAFDGTVTANTQTLTTALLGILVADGTGVILGFIPTAYHVLLGDTAGSLGEVATVGTAGQVLTSNGVGMGPSWESVAGAGAMMHFIVSNGTSPVDPDGSGNVTLTDGANVTITGALNAATFAVSGTTDHAVQVGNATGSLTSVSVGTTGTVLIGNTAADPSFSASPVVTSITINNAPIVGTDGANKTYVDLIAAGFSFKEAAKAASTANLNATYANGASGVGATLTNNGTLAAFTIDGQSPSVSDRILIKNQTNTFENGIYSVTTVGSGAIAWVLTRTTDYDAAAEIDEGNLVPVIDGTENESTLWLQTEVVNTVGTDAIIFVSFLSQGIVSITGDSGGALSGSNIIFTGAATGLAFAGAGTTQTLGGTLIVANGGTGATSFTDHGVILGSGTGPLSVTAVGTTGQVLTGVTGADPTWQAAMGANLTITSKTDANTPYTVLSADQYISCNVNGGALTINLPNSTDDGRMIRIKDAGGDAATNNISLTTPGGTVTIDGDTTYAMNTAYQSVIVVWNNTTSKYEIL